MYAVFDLEDLTEKKFELDIIAFDDAYSDGPKTLTVHLENIRVPPAFINLPTRVSVPEDVHVAAGIYQVSQLHHLPPLSHLYSFKAMAADEDNDNLTYSFVDIRPSIGIGKFLIDSQSGSCKLQHIVI